jgi:prolyl-tRNA editing enzyme YbaK/EbsC (Cys-tRNA(Pro) deacylase)
MPPDGPGLPCLTMESTLSWTPALNRLDLVAEPVAPALPDGVLAAEIDPLLADTSQFCRTYGVPLELSANCVIVAAKRGGQVRYAACLVMATARVDVNGAVRRHLQARKASFAAMDDATSLTGMEYGGITPLGLPDGWPVLVDPAVVTEREVVVGSGLRRSKLLLAGVALAALPNAEVLPLAL